jgi:2-succinyl-6-hydroxy-2,4-cyclohexadiene-1-carboxylate synthase
VAEVIHIFHGFLGSPNDFSFLKSENVVLHDLYEMLKYPSIGPEDILIGYSMGGRVALELASEINYKLNKLVLINAHPGLATEEERSNRTLFEDRVIQELESKTKEEFLSEWNSLPIFENDQAISMESSERFKKSSELFDRFRLSKQKDHLPEMTKNKERVLYIVGLQDVKYLDLAENYLLPHDINVKGISGGHRLFQRPEELKQVLMDEGII